MRDWRNCSSLPDALPDALPDTDAARLHSINLPFPPTSGTTARNVFATANRPIPDAKLCRTDLDFWKD
ncbi:hypothetical protein HME9302_02532 [Alteripontixanthobacter maritimus]|uniref:Uncharacterized protein n=1 Tax=Alteripontixanthobacter maritimus TaxID=2161824 RepID=A0A369Q8V2_9SPHN|nr:hypothetical protein HME9302_02532 [Alteripontixanthobacter maritimus]